MTTVRSVCGLSLAIAMLMAVSAGAQTTTENHIPVFVMIVDARPLPDAIANIEPAPKTVASFPYNKITGGTVDCTKLTDTQSVALSQVWGLLECATGRHDRFDLQGRVRAAKIIARVLPDLAKESSTRALSDKADYLLTAVIQTASLRAVTWKSNDAQKEPDQRLDLTVEGRVPKIVVNETARQSQIQQDAEALLKVVGALVAPAAAPVPAPATRIEETIVVTDEPFITAHEHAFRETRASVVSQVSVPADRPTVRLAQGLPDAELTELLKSLQARIKQRAEHAEAEKMRKASAELLEQCPPSGLGVYSPLRILSCGVLVEKLPADRAAAAEALGELGSRDAVLPLTLAARDQEATVRGAALRALGKLSAPPQVPAARQEPPAAASAQPAPTRSLTFLSGPAEHWFISADVILTSKDQITVDDEGTLSLEDPPSFYVGFGFLFGDLASTKRSLLGNVAIKALIKGTTSPLDSVGIALALRGEYLKKLGVNFELLSPFVAYTWTKDVTMDKRAGELRFGLGVNIDKAVDWLK